MYFIRVATAAGSRGRVAWKVYEVGVCASRLSDLRDVRFGGV